MRNEIQIKNNTIYEYDIECLRKKEEQIILNQNIEANMLALLLCLQGIYSKKDV